MILFKLPHHCTKPCDFNGITLTIFFFYFQVLYSGKALSLGIKQGGPSAGKWAELSITKSPKIVQVATGHDSQHALMISDDGSVFFVGTPRRGEDGDTSTCMIPHFSA